MKRDTARIQNLTLLFNPEKAARCGGLAARKVDFDDQFGRSFAAVNQNFPLRTTGKAVSPEINPG